MTAPDPLAVIKEALTKLGTLLPKWSRDGLAALALLRRERDELGPMFRRDCARVAGLPDGSTMDAIMAALESLKREREEREELRRRAKAAIKEVAQVRRGDWKGDKKFARFGETILDRYERLARAALDGEQEPA